MVISPTNTKVNPEFSSKNTLWDRKQAPAAEETKPAKPTPPPPAPAQGSVGQKTDQNPSGLAWRSANYLSMDALLKKFAREASDPCQLRRMYVESCAWQKIGISFAQAYKHGQRNFTIYIEGDADPSYAKSRSSSWEKYQPGAKIEIITGPLPQGAKFGKIYQGKIVYNIYLGKCPTDD